MVKPKADMLDCWKKKQSDVFTVFTFTMVWKKPKLQIVWFFFTSVALNIKLMVRSHSAMFYLLRIDSKMPRTASTSTGEDRSFTQWFHWALRHKRHTCQYILYVCVFMFMSLWWTETQTQSAMSIFFNIKCSFVTAFPSICIPNPVNGQFPCWKR